MSAGNKVGAPLASSGSISDVDSSARNPLGMEVSDDVGNRYIYLQGVASLAAGDWVVYNGSFATTRAVNTPVTGPAAVAMAAVVANKYGWFQIIGLTPATTAIASDGSADGKALFLSSTAGRATTTLASTQSILSAWASGASASNVGRAMINRPFCPGFILGSA